MADLETKLTSFLTNFQQIVVTQINILKKQAEGIETRIDNISQRLEGIEKYILTQSVNHDVLAKKNEDNLKAIAQLLPEGDDLLQG
jgi:uncharacterized protein (DUF1015 family)